MLSLTKVTLEVPSAVIVALRVLVTGSSVTFFWQTVHVPLTVTVYVPSFVGSSSMIFPFASSFVLSTGVSVSTLSAPKV